MTGDEARMRIGNAITAGFERGAGGKGQIETHEIEDAAEKLLPAWKEPPAVASPPGMILAFLPLNYVIPDHELKLVDTGFSVLSAAAAAGYFLPQLGFDPIRNLTAAITATIVGVLRIFYNLKVAVHLDECDHAIVLLLARARDKGVVVPALLQALRLTFPRMTTEEIERRLNALTACPTVSGTKSTLVWKDNQDQWRANGL